jgi:hypothetical protein
MMPLIVIFLFWVLGSGVLGRYVAFILADHVSHVMLRHLFSM